MIVEQVAALPNGTRAVDTVKYRAFQQVTSKEGFFEICAVDHLREFVMLLDPDVDSVSFNEVVAAKAELIRSVAPHSSAMLLDAEYSYQALALGALPRNTGIIAALEDETYTFPDGPRPTKLREGWSPAKVKLSGASMAKLLWFYRPDLSSETAGYQLDLLGRIQRECNAVSLPLVVEPIWFALPSEDTSSQAWKRSRVDGIIQSAADADAVGADLLKVEFPGSVGTESDESDARAACRALDQAISVPWVILSAGVGFDQFAQQVEIACSAGASGYMAGRSVWSDAVTRDEAHRAAGVRTAIDRLERLSQIARTSGRPFEPIVSLEESVEAAPSGWYRQWA